MEECHKCGRFEHFNKDCPMHKMDHWEYLNIGGEKEKKRDQVLVKSRRHIAVDFVVKQTLAGWEHCFFSIPIPKMSSQSWEKILKDAG